MFQQLSHYNYDYALASIPIQLILLIFYCSRRNLPVRSSCSFLLVMMANLVMTAFDLISCEMNEIGTEYPLWLMHKVVIPKSTYRYLSYGRKGVEQIMLVRGLALEHNPASDADTVIGVFC